MPAPLLLVPPILQNPEPRYNPDAEMQYRRGVQEVLELLVGALSGNVTLDGSLSATSLSVGTTPIYTGAGTPEGVVTAPVGALFLRTNGGAGSTLYVKESGTGNTGWAAK